MVIITLTVGVFGNFYEKFCQSCLSHIAYNIDINLEEMTLCFI